MKESRGTESTKETVDNVSGVEQKKKIPDNGYDSDSSSSCSIQPILTSSLASNTLWEDSSQIPRYKRPGNPIADLLLLDEKESSLLHKVNLCSYSYSEDEDHTGIEEDIRDTAPISIRSSDSTLLRIEGKRQRCSSPDSGQIWSFTPKLENPECLVTPERKSNNNFRSHFNDHTKSAFTHIGRKKGPRSSFIPVNMKTK